VTVTVSRRLLQSTFPMLAQYWGGGADCAALAGAPAGNVTARTAATRTPNTPPVVHDRRGSGGVVVWWYHDVMAKNLTVRLDDELAADAEALARAEGKSLNETVKLALSEAVERRRSDPKFKARVRKIIEQDRELLERLAK
jgi:hypothetical protein